MTSAARRTVVVPELGDELIYALTVAEELLLDLGRWEEDDPASVDYPFAGGAALEAVRRLWEVLAPTQGERRRGIAWYGPDARYEHTPLEWVEVAEDDLALLGAAVRELGRPYPSDAIGEALDAATEMHRMTHRREVVALLARLHGLLDLAPTEDTAVLHAAEQARAGVHDLVLTQAEGAAYQRTVDRLNGMWTMHDPLSRWTY